MSLPNSNVNAWTRFIRWLIQSCFVCGLASCNFSAENPASDYLKRLETVLDINTFEQSNRTTYSYPAPRELRALKQSYEISIREFMSLRECELHSVIAKRNSLIGKVAVSSQRLFNDLEILDTGPVCLLKLEATGKASLAKKLREFLNIKKEGLGASLWQAILGAQENAKFWSPVVPPDDYPNTLNHESIVNIAALYEFVESVKSGRYQYSQSEIDTIEKHLGVLRHGDGGQLLQQYAELVDALDRANSAIDQRLERPLCVNNKPSSQARYFQNVVNTFFVANVQSWAVALNRRYQQLMPTYRQLEQALSSGAPLSYREWAKQRDQLMSKARQATKDHATRIQQLFTQCGLTAGRPLS